MTLDEALETCRAWFDHLERQKVRTAALQRAARLARDGEPERARKIVKNLDRQPRVFDGARLRPAVEHLITELEGRA